MNNYHKINLDYRSWKLILWPYYYFSIILEIKTKLKKQNLIK